MKRPYFSFFVLLIAVSILPYTVVGADKAFSIAVKPGIYIPQSDLKDFDVGVSGEIAAAYKFTPNFAVEGGIGYFNTQDKFTQYGTLNGVPASFRDKFQIHVVPITVSVKGILPVNQWDFYGFGGVGAYMVYGELKERVTAGNYRYHTSGDDTDIVPGIHLGLGANYNIASRFFVGAEGKYVWTTKTRLDDNGLRAKFKLDGIFTTAVIGFIF